MKRIVLTSIAVLVLATTAFAQGGAVMLYADPAFTECNVDGAAALLTVYVVHEVPVGASAVFYAIRDNTGGALFYVADQTQFALNIGDSQSGIATTYSGCVSGQIHVLNVLYSVLSSPPACSFVEVFPAPDAPSGQIEGVDCSEVKNFPNGSILTFDGTPGTCQCGEQTPIEETNWGRVKALYQ